MIKSLVACGYGFVAGITAALVLWLMGLVSHLVWSGPDARWYIFAVICTGGIIIALLRDPGYDPDLAQQIAATQEPAVSKIRQTSILALSAIVAVGFGGAIGPEAGILAVMAELSAIVSLALARLHQPVKLVGEIGAAGALGGLYAGAPGAVMDEVPKAPKWYLFAAAIFGLAGFLLIAHRILPDNPLHTDLPEHIPAADGTEVLLALFPAMLGAGAGLLFAVLLPGIRALLARSGNLRRQTLTGTVLFALLAASFPILRFSGHHEMQEMLEWGQIAGMIALLALACLKILALSLCLASGWHGGAVFPLIFAGAAAGGAVLALIPQMPVTVALVAGIGGAIAAGMGKPIAAILIALLLIGPVAMGPLCTGLLIGWLASRLVPNAGLH